MNLPLSEIFFSFQGEGPLLGVPMLFIRSQLCDLSCDYCDTPASLKLKESYRLELPAFSGKFSLGKSPISEEDLLSHIQKFSVNWLSLTGGEPLLHVDFWQRFLKRLKGYKLLLETSGTRVQSLEKVIDDCDVISMDIKLPSVTKMGQFWDAHEAFLKVANRKYLYVKTVLSEDCIIEDLERVASLLKPYQEKKIEWILQPVSPGGKIKDSLQFSKLLEFEEIVRGLYPWIRVIPQMQKLLGVL